MENNEDKIKIINKLLYFFISCLLFGLIHPALNKYFQILDRFEYLLLGIFYVGLIGIFFCLYLKDKIKKGAKTKIDDEFDNKVSNLMKRYDPKKVNEDPQKSIKRLIVGAGYLTLTTLFMEIIYQYFSFFQALLISFIGATLGVLLTLWLFKLIYNNYTGIK